MQKRSLLLIMITITMVLFSGCRSSRRLPKKPVPTDTIAVVDTVAKPPVAPPTTAPAPKPAAPFKTLVTNYSCQVKGLTVNGQIRMNYDKAIWISANKIIELARVKITPDSVFAYIKPNNSYIRCTLKDFQRVYKIDLGYKELQSLLIGKAVQSNVVKATFSDFVAFDKVKIPMQALFNVTHRQFTGDAKLKYTKTELNQATTFPLTIPANATRIKVGTK